MKRIFRGISASTMAIGQGAFYVVSGLWPVLHLRSFEKVTGPKTDKWLVKTVGMLIAVSGAAILYAGLRNREGGKIPREIVLLARGQALSLGSISLTYSLIGRISKIYLLDAASEIALTSGWSLTRNN